MSKIKVNSNGINSKIRISPVKIKQSNFARKPNNNCVEMIMTADEIKKLLGGRISGKNILKKQQINYPKYYYSLINQFNSVSGATRPNRVGKLHTLFKQRKFRSLGEWKKWYNKKYPTVVKEVVKIIYDAIEEGAHTEKKFKRQYRGYIKKFVENLLFNQTYTGLKIQEAILIKISSIMKKDYQWSNSKEDSSGVDGFIGGIPISIKPRSSQVNKKPGTKRIYYDINEKNNTLKFTFSL